MGRTYEETGLVRAHAKWVRTSARKARVVLEHVRGLPVGDARVQLRFATRHAADDILRVLDSAIANAVNNHGLDEDSLVVAEAYADEGVTMKRWQPRARGRAMRIRKRTAHITILLRSVAPAETADEKPRRRRGRKAGTPEVAAPAPARGRRAKKAAEAAPVAEVAEETLTPAAEVAEAPEAAVTEAPEAEVAEETAEAEAAVAEPETAEAAPEDAAEAPEAEEKPKPKRTRRKKTDDDSNPEGEEA
jgi:large subunit ribosomal protein L22